jgi:GalNAc-alpha-(1->4)-GalNAc-alpha-(1->3)-diNAcBac-PP-undecaprenol alpha-1,4-N-acetyl-D-galactosaminyltransferase
MRLALVISSLGMGGAERVISRLAVGWAAQGVEVSLITLAGAQDDFFMVPETVRRVGLDVLAQSAGPKEAVANNLKRIRTLRSVLRQEQPDAVVSFMDTTNVLTLLAARGLGIPVVVSERIDLKGHGERLGRAWHLLRRVTYRWATAVVAVTREVARQLEELLPGLNALAIPNPVEEAACQGRPEVLLEGPTVIALGRLVPRKGFDLLIRAFSQCLPQHEEWQLAILGEGRDRGRLEGIIQELGLADKVLLPGQVREPGPVLAQSQVFALCSAYEGFPNSLLEAMACGLPSAVSDYAGGPREVVSHEKEALLFPVGDEKALHEALNRLMADSQLRERLGQAAKETARHYSLEAVLAQWNELLEKIIRSKHADRRGGL